MSIMKLPVNKVCASLFEALWESGADGEELMLGFLGALREVAWKQGGKEEIVRLGEAFKKNVIPADSVVAT